MLDAVREEWSIACDGDEMDMANWAIKWGNPIMDAMERRVLNAELQEENNKLKQAIRDVQIANGWKHLPVLLEKRLQDLIGMAE